MQRHSPRFRAERWRSKDGPELKESFTIVTTAASKFAGQFHDRMPVILEQDGWDLWLKGGPDVAAALMIPARESVLTERRVSKAINNVKNTGPEVLVDA